MNKKYWIAYPSTYKKQLKPLLHQQMWLFGRDILCPQGNLLYQYQFTHERASDRGGSMYTCWNGEQQVVLWGWGIWFGQAETGSIYVNRYKAKPRFTTVPKLGQPIHRPADLPRVAYRLGSESEAETVRGLWSDLLLWLAEYEAWVVATVGESWRQSTLRAFNHAVTKPSAVDQLAEQWQTLAEEGKTLPIKSYARQGEII
ncbi:MAG: hypothetical protein AAF614_02055 [Chloroflexota bacterium]